MGTSIFRAMLLASVSVTAAVGVAPVAAQAQEQSYDIDIPAQSLGDAIRALGRSTRQTIVFDGSTVRGKRSVAVRGRMTPAEALERMLAGSNLVMAKNSSGSLTVRLGNGQGGAELASSYGNADNSTGDSDNEIIVIGTNIRGVESISAPKTTLTKEDIQRSGHQDTDSLFRSIPQNFGDLSPEGSYTPTNSLANSNTGRAASSVDLRGLGPQSTLVLVNGRRAVGNSAFGQVFDISSIPLPLIEQVDIVTGGTSSIYGADAVAGVVNIQTRRKFDGFETELLGAVSPYQGGGSFDLSQTFGKTWDHAGFAVNYDYKRQFALDLLDTNVDQGVSVFGQQYIHTPIRLGRRQHAAFAAGEIEISPDIELYTEARWTRYQTSNTSEYTYPAYGIRNVTESPVRSTQWTVTGGTKVGLGKGWQVDASTTLSRARTQFEATSTTYSDPGTPSVFSFATDEKFGSDDYSIIADGPLASIDGHEIKVSLGGDLRKERYAQPGFPLRRQTKAIFGEVFIPLVEASESPLLYSLQFNLSGRYDHYSDFGGTFNPQYGVVWNPTRALRFRGTYSTAFRAPDLFSAGYTSVAGLIELKSDNGTSTPVLSLSGQSGDLEPERSRSFNLGMDYAPPALPNSLFSVSYYSISYRDRLATPAFGADANLILNREAQFPGLVTRSPTPQQVVDFTSQTDPGALFNLTNVAWDGDPETLLAAFPNLVLFDNRLRNISVEKLTGLDATANLKFAVGSGQLGLLVNSAVTFTHTRRTTAESPAVDQTGEVGKPTTFRGRVSVSWDQGPLGTRATLNYVPGYINPYTPAVSRIGSWTTLDLSVSLDGDKLSSSRSLKGVRMDIGITNALNSEPPYVRSFQNLAYDSANASAVGRLVTARLSKRW